MNYKVKGTDKDLFLKLLEKLFGLENSMFSFENTVIVDDSPVKQVTNFPWGYFCWKLGPTKEMDLQIDFSLMNFFHGFNACTSRGLSCCVATGKIIILDIST